MNAKELRIGNWVRHLKEEETVTWLSKDSINNIQGWYEPIKLTVDWLERLGFYEERTKDRITIEAWSLGHPGQRFNIDFKDGKILLISRYQGGSDNLTMDHIKYVHQLQNLYFTLTGEELINLTEQ